MVKIVIVKYLWPDIFVTDQLYKYVILLIKQQI